MLAAMSQAAAEVLGSPRARGAAVAVSAVAALAVIVLFLGGPSRVLETPLFDRGDGLFHVFVVDTVLRQGWYVADPRLGAPFGSSLLDFPMLEATHLLVIKLLGVVSRDPVVVLNAFLILSFPASAAAATAAMLRERVRPSLAAAGGFAFAILPYHFARIHHPFLASYVAVPIYASMLLDLARWSPDEPPWTRRRVTTRVATGLVLSGTGVYYAFFACVLAIATAIRVAVAHRSAKPIARAMFLVSVLGVGIGLQLVPSFVHAAREGSNPSVAHRGPEETELYGLKPIQLLIPARGHRIAVLDDLAASYRNRSPNTNENATASLGLLGAFGFLAAAGTFLVGREERSLERHRLGFLSVVAVLYASVGGLSAIIAYVAIPGIRSVNRISVFLGYFAMLVVVRAIERGIARLGPRAGTVARTLAVPLLAAIAMVDQVPTRDAVPVVAANHRDEDRRVLAALERAVPPNTATLVLPYFRFPEGDPRRNVDAYTPLRAVMASRSLRFSFGSMAARNGDLWFRSIHRSSLPDQVRDAARAGFGALIVFPDAIREQSTERLAELDALLGPPVATSREMVAYRIPSALGEGRPIHVAFALRDGFLGWERFEDRRGGSWAEGDATALLVHPDRVAASITLSMSVGSLTPRHVTIAYRGRTIRRLTLDGTARTLVELDLVVPPGASVLEFRTDRPAERPGPGDTRRLSFGIAGVVIRPRD